MSRSADNTTAAIEAAWQKLAEAEALLITAGAGMGVDSGLPDFRGTRGFWKAYPPYERLGLEFMSVANPQNFTDDPAFGWGFYGHRYQLYRDTQPHAGFEMLRAFGERLPCDTFVYTSNVDGHFEKAGFRPEQVVECHGSINHLQCLSDCQQRIWEVGDAGNLVIDHQTMRAQQPLPTCPDCGGIARPAILMFGDWGWNGARTDTQEKLYHSWLRDLGDRRLVIVELGAGKAVPTVRMQSESVASWKNACLIRINPREPEVPDPNNDVALPLGALDALEKLLR